MPLGEGELICPNFGSSSSSSDSRLHLSLGQVFYPCGIATTRELDKSGAAEEAFIPLRDGLVHAGFEVLLG